ncbi:MAG TPA: ABC transporter permease [Thermoclostridium sp.]|nr:ABC transporter permease [Thermoclostridium sp.]
MIINPILKKDLKTKLRGWRTMVLICCYILLLAAILFVYFAGNNMLTPRTGGNYSPRMAVDAYNLLIVFQFALLFLVVPAITATSITSERERQTLDLMLVTKTSATRIVLGKIMVSIAHTMLLLIASMPVLGVVFFFGGVNFVDIAKLLLFYVITSFFVASCGVFCSTLFKRNIVSIITTYIFLGLITFGPFIALLISVYVKELRLSGVGFNPTYGTYLKPLFPSSVFGFTSFYYGGSNMYGYGLWGSMCQEIESQMARETGILRLFKPWIVNSIFNIVGSAILILLSAVKLNPVRRKS